MPLLCEKVFLSSARPNRRLGTMSGNLTHVLFENASGYSLFEVNIQEEVAAKSKAVQEAVLDFSKFSRMVKLKSFLPFTSAAEALANANDVSEGALAVKGEERP